MRDGFPWSQEFVERITLLVRLWRDKNVAQAHKVASVMAAPRSPAAGYTGHLLW